MSSAIDRLVVALDADTPQPDITFSDLAAVLAVVEAAEELVKTAEITAWSLSPTHPLRQAVSEYRSAALAAIEGDKE